MSRNDGEEPNTAPEPDRWYNITLGPSFKDNSNHPSTKVFTLRYEFKPASIDKSEPGSLHKGKNNKVTVEYQNNQYGKPKVTFEGVSEDYKENDAVLFFDGETLRLERLHRAVKRLRHVRLPGESAAATVSAPAIETYSPPVNKVTNQQSMNKSVTHQTQVRVDQVAVIDSDSLGPSNPSAVSSELKDYEPEENVDVVNDNDDDFQTGSRENTSGKGSRVGLDIDINIPHQVDTDDEIADVDISDEEVDKGPNAAEALRAQVNAQGRKDQTSSSSTSTGSDSSASENGSGSGSGSRSRSRSRSGSGSGSSSSSSESESSENNSDISI